MATETAQPGRQRMIKLNPRHLASKQAPAEPEVAVGLLILNVFLPGAPRFLRGANSVGRWVSLAIGLFFWSLAVFVGLMALTNRSFLLALPTNPKLSLYLIIALVALAIWYVISFIDTLVVVRLLKQWPNVRIILAALCVPLLVISSGAAAYAASSLWTGRSAIQEIFKPNSSAGGDSTTPALDPVDGRYNFLLLGGDAGDDRAGRRPDSIMAFSVDAQTGAAATISIPRNFQGAPFPADSPLKKVFPRGYSCGDECIIGNLYSTVNSQYKDLYPGVDDAGAKAMQETTSEILGIQMQAYLLVDMANFVELIDVLGGVKMNVGGWVPKSGEATNIYGGHLPPVGWIKPGKQTLGGEDSLWFSRSREWTNDYARSQRQQCVVQAMIKQMNPYTVFTKFAEIAKAGTKILESDISTEQLGTFIDLGLKTKEHEVKRLTLGPPDFPADFSTYPNFKEIKNRVSQVLDKPVPSASADEDQEGATTRALEDPRGLAQDPRNMRGPTPEPTESATPSPTAPPTTQPNGQPITEDYLQQLARQSSQGNVVARDALSTLLSNNGECSPG